MAMPSVWIRVAIALAASAAKVAAQGPELFVDGNVFPGITPSADLEWHDCYNGTYKCARLEVCFCVGKLLC